MTMSEEKINKIVAFIPIKLKSKRFPNKNIKRFSDGTPLMELIQKTTLEVKEIDEVYVFCSDDSIQEYLLPGVKFLSRSKQLDSDSTNAIELLEKFIPLVDSDIYVMLHATSPFVTKETITKGINHVKSGRYDSAYPVKKMQNFIWYKGSPLNFSMNPVPRTQDVEPVYCELSNPFVFTKDVFNKYHQRTGVKPYAIEQSWIEAGDIDEPKDFELAQIVYSLICKNHE